MPSKKRTPRKKATYPVFLSAIRLVIQLSDTPHNRAVMDRVHAAMKAEPVQGPNAALKREDVKILSVLTTPTNQSTEPCPSNPPPSPSSPAAGPSA